MKQRLVGFTLLELLIGVAIFSGVLGTLFTVMAAMKRTEQFRDAQAVLTQGASFAFEPIIQSLRSADALRGINTGTSCVTVRGYYIQDGANPRAEWMLDRTDPIPLSSGQKLVTVSGEKNFTVSGGIETRWTKREYELTANDRDEKGQIYDTITETTYEFDRGGIGEGTDSGLLSCGGWLIPESQRFRQIAQRKLTSNRVNVTWFAIRAASPRIKVPVNPCETGQGTCITQRSDSAVITDINSTSSVLNSPFISLEITVKNPNAPAQTGPSTFTLRSTVTPNFTYGEQRN